MVRKACLHVMLFVSLICLHSAYNLGFFPWNSNTPIYFLSYIWNGRWYRKDFCVKMILDSCRTHWQQNHNLASRRHQPHLLMLGHIIYGHNIWKVFDLLCFYRQSKLNNIVQILIWDCRYFLWQDGKLLLLCLVFDGRKKVFNLERMQGVC